MQLAGMSNPDYVANIVGQQSSATTPDNSNDPRIAELMERVIRIQKTLERNLKRLKACEERMQIFENQSKFLLTNVFELLSEQASEPTELKTHIEPSEQSQEMDLQRLFAQATLSESPEPSESILTVATPSESKSGRSKKKIKVQNKDESLLPSEAFFGPRSFAEGTKNQTYYRPLKLVKQPKDGIMTSFKRSRLNSDVSPDQVSETVPSPFGDDFRQYFNFSNIAVDNTKLDSNKDS